MEEGADQGQAEGLLGGARAQMNFEAMNIQWNQP